MQSNVSSKRRALASKPGFYLVYMLFYFFPWLFKAPSLNDVIAIMVGIAVFLPIYFNAAEKHDLRCLPNVIGISLVGFAVSPFFGSHGVFHIFACAQAGFIRPVKSAVGVVLGVTIAYLAFALLTNQSWWDVFFPVFVAVLVATGSVFTADQIEEQSVLRRSNEYDQQMAALAERERIANDLHDLLGQTLTLVTLKSDIALKLMEKDPQRAALEIAEIRDASRDALRDVRSAIYDMNKTDLETELRRAKKILNAAGVNLEIHGSSPDLSAQNDHVLGLALRESITNIIRHAQASEAVISFDVTNEQVLMEIQDNGTVQSMTEGSGLSGIRKRVEELAGQVVFERVKGMRVLLSLPISALQEDR